MATAQNKYILWFKEIRKEDIPQVGGKGANLGEMTSFGIPVPNGFVITSQAYFDFLKENDLSDKIKEILKVTRKNDPHTYAIASSKIQKLIGRAAIPNVLAQEILKSYLKLGKTFRFARVAVRSSATAEDLPGASFAGQQATFLGVEGEANVVSRVRDCWASLFEARAIFYREMNGFEHMKVGIAVPVQEMVPAEMSGVMFTADPVQNIKNKIIIEAIYGLGEYIVQGIVSPDKYVINSKTFDIISRHIEKQTVQLVESKNESKEVIVPEKIQFKRKLTDDQIVELAKIGAKIHQHYFFPQDIEWTLYKGRLSIVQTRPITTLKEANDDDKKEVTEIRRDPILAGVAASPGIVSGKVQIIHSKREIGKVDKGEILVTSMTSPDFVPAMKKAAAIVTDKGGLTSHAAIVSRELGVPCVVGTENATRILKNGQLISVDGLKGEVYRGGINLRSKDIVVSKVVDVQSQPSALVKTATKIYVNLAEPHLAEKVANENVDGVGLLRAEFMIAGIGIHPKKLIKDKKGNVFVDKLSEGILQICKAFYPNQVVYRATDFKTNEYVNLIGGKQFEPVEANPLLGYRGALRYVSDPQVFELELKAIKKVRRDYNNLSLMIPFVRTPREMQEVKKIIVANGLLRSASFRLWLMVEIPANVILLKQFIECGIDGVSIGSNDLTMLLLGADRDNHELAELFDERNPAVYWALEKTIKTCNKYRITSSICGQAPSVYPEIVEKLVEWGVTSISVNPDAIERTRQLVYRAEEKKLSKR